MPPPVPPPTAGGLAPFEPSTEEPWDARRARHLLRRTGFYAPPASVTSALARTPVAAANAVVDAALAAPPVPVPTYVDLFPPPTGAPAGDVQAYNTANGLALTAESNGVLSEALALRAPGTALTERLALALHGVLTTHYNEYGNRAHRLHRYWTLLRRHALGSYQTLVREVGLTPAMLLYLDGNLNRVGSPNENYARELLELFTTGIEGPDGGPNYTQQDVAELARCLTGWTVVSASNEAVFVPNRHDAGQKTVFGVTGAFGYDAAIDLIFTARAEAVARRLARVLYQTFVAGAPNEEVVAELATTLRANAFAIGPAVRALVSSRHFFSVGAMGARIKSPFEMLLGLAGASGYSDPAAQFGTFRTQARDQGFDLFRPPDVAGWPGGRSWLDTGRLPTRWVATDRVWARKNEARALAMTMPDPYDPYLLVDALAEHVLAVPLPAATRAEGVTVLLGGIPDYEWDPTISSAEGRIRGLLQFLSRLPEAQLA
jgi:hypothetical protein